ncbi:MAG: hypothetical protein HZA01_14280 [Nitrospinae bacterium]|nr:hypothetical protein [Nitrospinota bacterium]
MGQRAWELPPLKLDHLRRLTDDTGILQHAIFIIPNYCEGYTTDDNALRIYYGAADTSIALATASIRAMLEWLKEQRG